MQQTPDFLKGIREKMCRKSVVPLPVREVLGQSLQVVHVLGKVFRDMGFQNFENAAFTPSH